VVLFAIYYVSHKSPTASPFDEFAQSTEKIFHDISAVELPASDVLIQNKVDCSRAANMIQESMIFKDNGHIMAGYLRVFGEGMIETGHSLRNMYEGGDKLFVTFDIEIRDMVKILRTGTTDGSFAREYIVKKLEILRKGIKDYQAKVSIAKERMKDTINDGSSAQKALMDGKRAAKILSEDKTTSAGVKLFQEEVDVVNKMLGQFDKIAFPLETLYLLLKDYDVRLMDMEALMRNKEIDESSIESLWQANVRLKKMHAAFLKKAL